MNKEIMEIIQPYMDKTLSEGCWINLWWYNYKKIYKRLNTYKFLLYSDNEVQNVNLINCPYSKIWHYDITAVLKYIHIKLHKFDEDALDWDTILVRWYKLNKEHSIPNKPLHLYSEQEEEDLLELLKKLW